MIIKIIVKHIFERSIIHFYNRIKYVNMDIKEVSNEKDLVDSINKIIELRKHLKSSDKKAIKKVLLEAKKIAPKEITALEWKNNENVIVDFAKLPLKQLYRKILQYQNGLKLHCLNKVSEAEFEKYLKKYGDCL